MVRLFSPSPAQSIPTPASPSSSSPTGTNSLTKIVVAQVYLLLSTIREDKDRTKWEAQAEQLRKLIDDHGMEVFQKYFSRLVVGNAPQIFPGLNRTVANSGNYQILVNEVRKISSDVEQAGRIAESIETANEDLFRDFDLSTFMEHFKMDALEKTILALAFKTGSRSDLKTKADAILSANYATFLQILQHPSATLHGDLSPAFVATIVDRFIQEHPPNFNEMAKRELEMAIKRRYMLPDTDVPPTEVLAALCLMDVLRDENALAMHLKRIGSSFTADEDTCTRHLRNVGAIRNDEMQVAAALLYAVISRTPKFSPAVLVNSLRREVPNIFSWQAVTQYFDQEKLRLSSEQFLSLFNALRPVAEANHPLRFDLQSLWSGQWRCPETQLSFICAYASLSPEQLDATTIPGLSPSFELVDYGGAPESVRERATRAVRHPLVSVEVMSAIFNVALQSPSASDSAEAKRLFQEVVVPNLDIFVVSAFGVPRPWPDLAVDTLNPLFDRFLFKMDPSFDFVLYSLWQKDRGWVIQRLIDVHARNPLDLPTILDHAVRLGWLDDLVILNGFGLDLAALAHSKGHLDLEQWQLTIAQRGQDLAPYLMTFLNIKTMHELAFQRGEQEQPTSVSLPVKTIAALLNILTLIAPPDRVRDSQIIQRQCITAYPRLINYGEGFDDIIDENGQNGNHLPKEANDAMEDHYKKMYSGEVKVAAVVEALREYKNSRIPAHQDIFACMIHGLFDEYQLYSTYPLEALKTTALLFGGIIRRGLLPLLPLEIGLGMILDAIKEHTPDQPMYKFGLQALKQTLERFHEWPGFCGLLLPIPSLKDTDVWLKAEEVVRDRDVETSRQDNGQGIPNHVDSLNGEPRTNGNFSGAHTAEPAAPPFAALNVDPPIYGNYEEPSGDTQEKVLFVLNNITDRNLDSKFRELKEVIDTKHQQWFAGHLVEERAKMQPNYHQLYLDLVKLFEDKSLWTEVIRESYTSVIRMLNAETTMQSSTERTHLKNLGGWLGSLTLARDKPIKHRNIAFKQLLMEAYDTQRLIVVIPFVCKVLLQAANSTVFRPPNPWLMDIIYLLIELYQNAELKLNLKFEIEVLCKELSLDHKSIQPSADLQTRLPPVDEPSEPAVIDVGDRFDSLSLSGMGAGVGSGRFSPEEIISSIPDLGPLLVYPPANDMVNEARLHELVKIAITRAVHEIIAPVVERSVTIAAISTAQMIHKDFATEPDENRLRTAAINMVKRTAGSLALVTSKEPLRASMSNYIRSHAAELPQGLADGTIIMCVNSNLDMACGQVERMAEERAVPEIEEMLESEIEARRRHRATRPNEPYVDPNLSRWAMTIPAPYKLLPGTPNGLNPQQMAIYEDFARQPRVPPLAASSSHGVSSSDATRSLANDVLQDQYPAIQSLPPPADNGAMQHIASQQPSYAQPPAPVTNGRIPGPPVDPRVLIERIAELLDELVRSASSASEQHYMDLPRPHPVIDIVDALISLIIRNSHMSDDASRYTCEQIIQILFTQALDDLAVESLVHVVENLCRFPGTTARRVVMLIAQQPDETLLNVPLALSLIRTDTPLLDWQRLDASISKQLQKKDAAALAFLSTVMERVLFNDHPIALYTDFARSLEAFDTWFKETPTMELGQQLIQKLKSSGLPQGSTGGASHLNKHREQMEYIFEEWVHLCNNTSATDKVVGMFIHQLHDKQILVDSESSCLFFHICIDMSVDRFDYIQSTHGLPIDAYAPIDALAKLIVRLLKHQNEDEAEVKSSRAAYLDSMLSSIVLVINHHHLLHGERFNQKVFHRLFSTLLCELDPVIRFFPGTDQQRGVMLVVGQTLLALNPMNFPGFLFAWMSLISHRYLLPALLDDGGEAGGELMCRILETLLRYFGELSKPLQLANVTRDLYRGILKVLVVIKHDFPQFITGYHGRLCVAIPFHCPQLRNTVLTAEKKTGSKLPDPLQPGLQMDLVADILELPNVQYDFQAPLKRTGLLDLIDQALNTGPSEDAVAHIAHAIQRRQGHTTIGFVPVNVDLELVDAIVLQVATHAAAKAAHRGGPIYTQASSDAALLNMLIHELGPEARYHFLNGMINQLRYPNAHTHYFSQAILEAFGGDMNDQEESDIRQTIIRIFFERIIAPYPHPWGFLVTVVELMRNEKYMFYDLPFIKASPEVVSTIRAVLGVGL